MKERQTPWFDSPGVQDRFQHAQTLDPVRANPLSYVPLTHPTQASKSKKGKGKRLVTNLREAPYSLKDGDVVAVVDTMEDEFAQADLTRADDEVTKNTNLAEFLVSSTLLLFDGPVVVFVDGGPAIVGVGVVVMVAVFFPHVVALCRMRAMTVVRQQLRALYLEHMRDMHVCLSVGSAMSRVAVNLACLHSIGLSLSLLAGFDWSMFLDGGDAFGGLLPAAGVPRAWKGAGEGQEDQGRQEEEEESAHQADGAGGRPHPGRLGEGSFLIYSVCFT